MSSLQDLLKQTLTGKADLGRDDDGHYTGARSTITLTPDPNDPQTHVFTIYCTRAGVPLALMYGSAVLPFGKVAVAREDEEATRKKCRRVVDLVKLVVRSPRG